MRDKRRLEGALIGQVDAVFRGVAIRERGKGREEKATNSIRRRLPRARIPSPPLNEQEFFPLGDPFRFLGVTRFALIAIR